jgi:hypothetical protein
VLAAGFRPHPSSAGIAWTAVTAAVMFALAAGKSQTGKVLGNPVLQTEGRVTLIDAIFGMDPEGVMIYLADHVDEGRMPDELDWGC